MLERLYQADYSPIFGPKYANAFAYPQVDSLIWPLFTDKNLTFPPETLKLLSMKDRLNNAYFYRRKTSLDEFQEELRCSNIGIALVQGLDLDKDYGIPNSLVLNVIGKKPQLIHPILSIQISNEGYQLLKKTCDKAAGVVVYPLLQNLELLRSEDPFNRICKLLEEKKVPLKIDLDSFNLPESSPEKINNEKIIGFVHTHPYLKIIISGIDFLSNESLLSTLRRYDNSYLELDPRSIGGFTPTQYFKELFSITGFIQNFWNRIIIGSAAPTLEPTQVIKGLWEATENMSFCHKCILRTWAFRNAHRVYNIPFETEVRFTNPYDVKTESTHRTDMGYYKSIVSTYTVKIRSFANTQLISTQPIIEELFNQLKKKYTNIVYGEVLIRTLHTTTSLVINENEPGNYLDLHYKFAEEALKESQGFMHTVLASENRPDFNPHDHITSIKYGDRQIILPIEEGTLKVGGREHLYVLVNFGPRSINIYLKFNLTIKP